MLAGGLYERRSGAGLVNLNVHFHLVVPDGVFVDDDDRLAFALHPVPTSTDVAAILEDRASDRASVHRRGARQQRG